MTIEELTDEEREEIRGLRHSRSAWLARKALRVMYARQIDAYALESQVAELTRERDEARERADHNADAAQNWHSEAAKAQVLADSRFVEVTRLTEALAAAEKRIIGLAKFHEERSSESRDALEAAEARVRELEARSCSECGTWENNYHDAQARAFALESECAALRAEVKRLQKSEAQWKHWGGTAVNACDRAESRLAVANALLGRCQQVVSPVSLLGRDLDAHLAAQPATAPDYDPITAPVPEGDMNGPHGELPALERHPMSGTELNQYDEPAATTRTDAEQRVLEAMAVVPMCTLLQCSAINGAIRGISYSLAEAGTAELARRETK